MVEVEILTNYGQLIDQNKSLFGQIMFVSEKERERDMFIRFIFC